MDWQMAQATGSMETEGLRVREVLELLGSEDYKLVAGEAGINNVCQHMIVMETPEGIEWLKGDEFLLTSGYAIKMGNRSPVDLIYRAKEKNLAAFAIKEKRYLPEITQEMRYAANYCGLPLIVLPQNVVYTEITAKFYEKMFYKRNAYLMRAREIDTQLLNLVFDREKADNVIVGLSGLLHVSMCVYGDTMLEMASCFVNPDHEGAVQEVIPLLEQEVDLDSPRERGYTIAIKEKSCFVYTFPLIQGQTLGLALVVSDATLDVMQLRAIRHGCMIFSLKIREEERLSLKNIKMRRTLTELILNSPPMDKHFYESIEYDYSWNRRNIRGMVLCAADGGAGFDERFKQFIYSRLDRLFEDSEYLLTERARSIYIFFGLPKNVSIESLIKRLQSDLKAYSPAPPRISFGISRQYRSIRDVTNMFHDCSVTTLYVHKKEVTYYEDMDVAKLLHPLLEDRLFQEYYASSLGVLLDYDNENQTSLVNTLKCYFDCGMSKAKTAAALYIHVETLRYRLQKMQQLTGLHFDNNDDLLVLQLCHRLHRMQEGLQ